MENPFHPESPEGRAFDREHETNRDARENVARCRAFIVQAIVTKFLGPTNSRGSRIKATAAAGSVIVNVDHRLNSEENHAAAATALAEKFGWSGVWFQGGMPNDSGYVFVCAARTEQDLATTAATFITIQKQV